MNAAIRRRRQAVMGYRHLARIGRGNNNRPIIHAKSATKLDRIAAKRAEMRKLMMARGKKR